jgi:hypothetical protein
MVILEAHAAGVHRFGRWPSGCRSLGIRLIISHDVRFCNLEGCRGEAGATSTRAAYAPGIARAAIPLRSLNPCYPRNPWFPYASIRVFS